MNKIFKYRSLGDLKRFLDIIVNKWLYGAIYLTLNDPMEGQLDLNLSNRLHHSKIQQLFDERVPNRICSLSTKCNSKGVPDKGIHETEKTDEYSIFELQVRPTYDFQQKLLWNGEDIEVLEPLWLHEKIARKIKRMWNKYKKD